MHEIYKPTKIYPAENVYKQLQHHSILCIQFVGLHGNYGTDGKHCNTLRVDYPSICSEVYGSSTATVTDLQTSFDSGHECCLCGFTDTSVEFFLQGTPGYCGNKRRGWYPGSQHCRACSTKSSVYCVHDTGNEFVKICYALLWYNNTFHHPFLLNEWSYYS